MDEKWNGIGSILEIVAPSAKREHNRMQREAEIYDLCFPGD
jgi:hypothetical protein